MSVIFILIAASLALATIFLLGFIWSVRSGQYDDTLTPSMRVLTDAEGRTSPEGRVPARPKLSPSRNTAGTAAPLTDAPARPVMNSNV